MKLKCIVKENWLPLLPSLPLKAREALAREILIGDEQGLQRMPIWRQFSKDEQIFLCAKTLQIAGKPQLLLEQLRAFDVERWKAKKDSILYEDLAGLKAFALSRLGREQEAGDWYARLPSRFRALSQIEKALACVNQGDFISAETIFMEVMEDSSVELDPFSACTLLGGVSLALIQQGKFIQAERAIQFRKNVLRQHSSPVLSFGTLLYEVLLLLERNHFSQAESLLQRALRDVNRLSVNGFFLLHLKLRLSLARNELKVAEEVLKELKALLRELPLPEGVLDFRLEELEWAFRSGSTPVLLEQITEWKKRAEERKDEFFLFRLRLLEAQALYHAISPKEALRGIEFAIQTGEKRGYRPGLTWAFFHAAGIAVSAGQAVQAKLFLHRGRRLSEELRLDVRRAAFTYMGEVLENRFASASSLLSLVRHQEIGPELEYFLDAYGLLASVRLQVKQGGVADSIDEPALRRRLFGEPGVFWFQKETVLVANLGKGKVESAEFEKDSAPLAAFQLFWANHQKGERGLRLEDLHRARSPLPYREDRHGPAAKMLLSRLRSRLEKLGLQISYHREAGRYSLETELPCYQIQSIAVVDPAKKKPGREAEILERVAMEGFVSTKQLCEEFQVSRQALHPVLKKLCQQKKLRLVFRGPISGYMALGS